MIRLFVNFTQVREYGMDISLSIGAPEQKQKT